MDRECELLLLNEYLLDQLMDRPPALIRSIYDGEEALLTGDRFVCKVLETVDGCSDTTEDLYVEALASLCLDLDEQDDSGARQVTTNRVEFASFGSTESQREDQVQVQVAHASAHLPDDEALEEKEEQE